LKETLNIYLTMKGPNHTRRYYARVRWQTAPTIIEIKEVVLTLGY